jgi:hypothetical protein
MPFLLTPMFSLQQNQRKRGAGEGRKGGRREEVAQIMYIHVSKCKNDKRKKYGTQRVGSL